MPVAYNKNVTQYYTGLYNIKTVFGEKACWDSLVQWRKHAFKKAVPMWRNAAVHATDGSHIVDAKTDNLL